VLKTTFAAVEGTHGKGESVAMDSDLLSTEPTTTDYLSNINKTRPFQHPEFL
jgi:hypothetical protein